ncbi:GNAT family N-acetyltransferase [Bradyrhizobium tropiciagri]|uniref:GNAT family N-acetyltransferase n=1 Tax=Bradyrhizobium tropiciagri TaxID=312253 RepID=UPI00067D79CA|nr:GNAT family N-acetyltransferase [Bradyrhizobium tropiciagri]
MAPLAPIDSGVILKGAISRDELTACFPVICELRPYLKGSAEWVDRASSMAAAGYRVLAAWRGQRVLAIAGYRVTENLIHGRFLYVDDLVTTSAERSHGLGAALLGELTKIGKAEGCRRLVLDTAATNIQAQRFYKREGLMDTIVGFVKALGDFP